MGTGRQHSSDSGRPPIGALGVLLLAAPLLSLAALGCAGAPDSGGDDPMVLGPDGGDPITGDSGDGECGTGQVSCGDVCCAAPPPNGESVELKDIAEGQIVTDSKGAPRVAYRAKNGEVRYAVWNPETGGWKITRVDGAGGYGVAVAMDASDHPHLCYTRGAENTSSTLYYAHFNGTSWTSLQVPGVTGRCAVAISAGTTPNLLYRAGATLVYTRKDPTRWSPTAIPNLGASQIAMRIDGKNSAHIAFVEGSGATAKVRYVTTADKAKTVVTVATAGADTIDRIALGLDESGAPGVLFSRASGTRKLVYASLKDAAWTETTVIDTIAADDYFAMATDSSGVSHAVVTSPTTPVEVHRRVNGAWRWIDVEEDGVTSPLASVAGDRFGRTHVLAQGANTFYLSFAK
jgi:hypothetical protein